MTTLYKTQFSYVNQFGSSIVCLEAAAKLGWCGAETVEIEVKSTPKEGFIEVTGKENKDNPNHPQYEIFVGEHKFEDNYSFLRNMLIELDGTLFYKARLFSEEDYEFETDEHPVTGKECNEPLVVRLPVEIVKCYDCGGRGTTYLGWSASEQPAFTEEDMHEEGPEFLEDYMNGAYDKVCPGCKGSQVVNEIAWEHENAKGPLALAYRQHLDDEDAYRAECEAERRMGC